MPFWPIRNLKMLAYLIVSGENHSDGLGVDGGLASLGGLRRIVTGRDRGACPMGQGHEENVRLYTNGFV